MHSASRQLYDLINDLLDYSKYGSRDQPTQRDPVDLRAVVDEHVRSFKPTARQRMLTLEWEPPAEPLIARGSARELGKVVRNLLSNAVKFTPFGGRISVLLTGDELALRLKVIDTGIGMSPEVQAKLFTPFFQGDATSTRAFEGTGIGLALVKTIVNRHDGGIAVSSVQGQGTTMTVTLPRSPLDPTELAGMELGVMPALEPGQHDRPRPPVLRALAEASSSPTTCSPPRPSASRSPAPRRRPPPSTPTSPTPPRCSASTCRRPASSARGSSSSTTTRRSSASSRACSRPTTTSSPPTTARRASRRSTTSTPTSSSPTS
jgi:hypothetical protein